MHEQEKEDDHQRDELNVVEWQREAIDTAWFILVNQSGAKAYDRHP